MARSPSSHDLFSSQSSGETGTRSLLNEQIDITLQLTDSGWVQCDHPDCQKWRRVPSGEIEAIGEDPWFCHMSSDPVRNICGAAEEDHKYYDRLAKKVGLKFVMSRLQVGALVSAQLTGYCSWPAIVTRDVLTGCHVRVDLDGDPISYHVEYLGQPRTHGWVYTNHVELYGHKTQENETKQPGLKRKKYGGKLAKVSVQKTKKKSYRKMKIDDVLKEADLLLQQSCDQRLETVVFKYDPDKAKILEEKEEQNRVLVKEENLFLKDDFCKNCGKDKRPGKQISRGYSLTRKESQKLIKKAMKQSRKTCSLKANESSGIDKEETFRKDSRLTKREDSSDQQCSGVAVDDTFGRNNGTTIQQEQKLLSAGFDRRNEPGNCSNTVVLNTNSKNHSDSPKLFTQSQLKFCSSMIDKTKEEKFKIDIEMYRRNERAFEHDVRRFMSRNNMKLIRTPCWHNVPISLFQLFLAVHERGGFKKVCEKKCWAYVYRELTDQQTSSGTLAKKYYERNLYPYELYMCGKSYENEIEKRGKKKKTADDLEDNDETQPSAQSSSVDPVLADSYREAEDFCQVNLEGGECTDLEAMLEELEEDYNSVFHMETKLDKAKEKFGIEISFHDESPFKKFSPGLQFADTASEFGVADLPEDMAVQEVPEGDSVSIGSDNQDEQILHELHALDDQMQAVNQEIENFL